MSVQERETPKPEQEPGKEAWLKNLATFIVIANGRTWAADGAEVDAQRPGYKELQWPYTVMNEEEQEAYKGWEEWKLRDSYTGYFRAPGMTTVYYKDKPVWTMQYGGHGQTEGHEDGAKRTFDFLRHALMRVTTDLPIRGPMEYVEGDNRYEFEMLEGNLEDGLWREKVIENGVQTFTQTGLVGIVINKDSDRQPVSPWNL